MMKTFFIPALALAAASLAVPAMAQTYGTQHRDDRGGRYEQDRGGRYEQDRRGRYEQDRGDRYEHDRRGRYEQDGGGRYDNHRDARNWQAISQRKYQLDRRIDQGERNRQLSRGQASRLRAELNALVRLEHSYMRGGLSHRERAELDRRYDWLSMQVRAERRDRPAHRRNDDRRW